MIKLIFLKEGGQVEKFKIFDGSLCGLNLPYISAVCAMSSLRRT